MTNKFYDKKNIKTNKDISLYVLRSQLNTLKKSFLLELWGMSFIAD